MITNLLFQLLELDGFLIKEHGLLTEGGLGLSKTLLQFFYDRIEGICGS